MYGKHYLIQNVWLSNQMGSAEIYEKDYTGDVQQIDAGGNTFIHTLLAANEDVFSPIIASELEISANITDFEGELPDFITNDDRLYYVSFFAQDAPGSNNATIKFRNFELSGVNFADCNLYLYVNGVNVVQLFTNETSAFTVITGDIVRISLVVFNLTYPVGTSWLLQIQDNGVDIYNVVITTPVIGENQFLQFTARGGHVYTAIAKSYSMATPGPAIPGNELYPLWQGFILTDAARIPFTTGYIGMQFSCTDGFAMLKNIPYEPTNPDINVLESLLQVILNCLNKLAYPNGFYLNICTSIFANGMTDRGDDPDAEPLSQIYYPPRNWQNSPTTPVIGVENTNFYLSCYDVLYKIAISFGAVIKQSEGQFYFASVTEQAGSSILFTQYDELGNITDSGSLTIKKAIAPYLQDKSIPHYFVNNNQAKLLRKGFPDVQLKCPTSYAPQCIDNGDMERLSGGFPVNWNPSVTGTVTKTTLGPYNAINLQPTGIGPSGRAQVNAGSAAPGYIGDRMSLSFWIDGQSTPSSTKPKCWLRVVLTTAAAANWWLDSSNNWILETIPTPIGNYDVIGNTSATYEAINITTPPFPASGTLAFIWITDNTDTFACTIANVLMTFISPYQYFLIRNDVTDLSYEKIIELPMGGACDLFSPNEIGSLTDSGGVVWTGWYRYGFPVESYNNLMGVVYQNIFNVISRSSINLDADVMSIFGTTSPICAFNCFEIQDSSGKVSVSGRKYLPGNSTIDYAKDVIQITLLETSDTDLPATIMEKQIPKNIPN